MRELDCGSHSIHVDSIVMREAHTDFGLERTMTWPVFLYVAMLGMLLS
jgi:hypothetical protein